MLLYWTLYQISHARLKTARRRYDYLFLKILSLYAMKSELNNATLYFVMYVHGNGLIVTVQGRFSRDTNVEALNDTSYSTRWVVELFKAMYVWDCGQDQTFLWLEKLEIMLSADSIGIYIFYNLLLHVRCRYNLRQTLRHKTTYLLCIAAIVRELVQR